MDAETERTRRGKEAGRIGKGRFVSLYGRWIRFRTGARSVRVCFGKDCSGVWTKMDVWVGRGRSGERFLGSAGSARTKTWKDVAGLVLGTILGFGGFSCAEGLDLWLSARGF